MLDHFAKSKTNYFLTSTVFFTKISFNRNILHCSKGLNTIQTISDT